MSVNHGKSELEKELELERMVLFSDAVFAIALTLLVIDIKFPEVPKDQPGNLLRFFRPTLIQFLAFTISFLFISVAWARHLRLFRLLRKYDQGLIARNLIYLFFIVIFPFTASGIANIPGYLKHGLIVPVVIYLFNITSLNICDLILCRYIFFKKPNLAVEGEAAEKKYMYISAQYFSLLFLALLVVTTLVSLIYPDHPEYTMYPLYFFPVTVIFARRRLKKHKPKTTGT
jgi:uncharacterized membrane protein